MQAQIEISENALTEAMAQSLFKGELGAMVAERLAEKYATITTYNRSDAAKLLNISRPTLYDYEAKGLIEFSNDGRVSLAGLQECRRKIASGENCDDSEEFVNRKPQRQKRRILK